MRLSPQPHEPPPCGGTCADDFTAAVIALEDEAGRLGFELVYVGLRHLRCGKLRASATRARRRAIQLRRELIDRGADS